jgi:multidrug resistance efflux pump
MTRKLYISKLVIATFLLSLATLKVAASKPVHDLDFALFQAELENRRISYERTKTLGEAGAVSQTYVDHKEAKYKLFAAQVVYYQHLTGDAQKDYARLLKIQNAETCPEFQNSHPSNKFENSNPPSFQPSPPLKPSKI